jgi:hypothetical protein
MEAGSMLTTSICWMHTFHLRTNSFCLFASGSYFSSGRGHGGSTDFFT